MQARDTSFAHNDKETSVPASKAGYNPRLNPTQAQQEVSYTKYLTELLHTQIYIRTHIYAAICQGSWPGEMHRSCSEFLHDRAPGCVAGQASCK